VEFSDGLEEKGLIGRARSGVDRREVLLSLTRRGEELLQELSELHTGTSHRYSAEASSNFLLIDSASR
jgi:DNA-binding MarR family transcriptional regulator